MSVISLLCAAAPASAAELVTTSDTDFEPLSVVIVSPEDGAVIVGSPDAVIAFTIEHEGFGSANAVSLRIDDVEIAACPDAPPCTIEATVAPGIHKVEAIGDDGIAPAVSHAISIEVKETGSSNESDTDTDTDTGSPTSGTEPATDTDATAGETDGEESDGSSDGGSDGSSDGSGSGSDDKEGCGCKAAPGLPDVLGLALLALFAPWRRRRHA